MGCFESLLIKSKPFESIEWDSKDGREISDLAVECPEPVSGRIEWHDPESRKIIFPVDLERIIIVPKPKPNSPHVRKLSTRIVL